MFILTQEFTISQPQKKVGTAQGMRCTDRDYSSPQNEMRNTLFFSVFL